LNREKQVKKTRRGDFISIKGGKEATVLIFYSIIKKGKAGTLDQRQGRHKNTDEMQKGVITTVMENGEETKTPGRHERYMK